MSERQPILPGSCSNFCFVEDAIHDSQESYADQPEGSLIADPQPVIDGLLEQLQRTPCEFTKSGRCRAAEFLVESSLNVELKGN